MNNNLKVVIRVDASLAMGGGHVMRCLTLAEVLKENGADIEFICRKHEGNLIDKIRKSGFHVFELELLAGQRCDNKLFHSHWLGVTQQQDTKDCINILQQIEVDWLVVDHYGIDEDWQKNLKEYCNKLMAIDDLADRKHQCDMLLDQTFGRQRQDYQELVPKSCKLLLGSQYALLRPEFAKWRQYSIERRKHPVFRQLLINMGSVDADNVTEQIVKEIETCDLPNDINITVVMGSSAPHLESVKEIVGILPDKSEVKVDVDNMAEIMANADMAIGAAGATTWERCCLGLPTIQIVIAKNQSVIAKLLARKDAIKFLQDMGQLASMIKNPTSWMKSITNVAKQISDGLGSKRVASKIIDKKI